VPLSSTLWTGRSPNWSGGRSGALELGGEPGTNAQIAAEPFLSTKTVESYVRNLFQKLGVSSRVELARVVEWADRATPAP